MASPIRVKEEAVDIFHVATDSDGDTEGEDISLEDLQQLDSKFATDPNLLKFPVGCKIWYNARNSRAQTKLLRAKSASVVGVYMHLEKMLRVYKVRSDVQSQYDVFLYEDRLLYGMNCPVTVGDAFTNDTCDGVIVCPKLDAGNDGKQQIAYDVQITQGSNVTVEFGVAAKRIKCRMEDSIKKVCIDKTTKGENEGGNGVKEVETKEKKVDYEEAKEVSKGHSISTNSNDVEVSALKPGVEQLEASALPPAPSAKAASGVKVAKAGNVAADEYSKLADTEMIHGTRQTTTSYEPRTRWEPPKRSVASAAIQRPLKMAKTESDGSYGMFNDGKCTLTLHIPPWMPLVKQMQQGQKGINLFHHLIGVRGEGKKSGHKTKWISSTARCKVHISSPEVKPMTIKLSSEASENVEQAICMVEESLIEFLSDENAEKRLIYDLAASAFGSYKIERVQSHCGLLVKRFAKEKKSWWCMLELPDNVKGGYDNRTFSLYKKQLPQNCKIEVFSDAFGTSPKHTSPYVFISGDEVADARVAESMTAAWMRS